MNLLWFDLFLVFVFRTSTGVTVADCFIVYVIRCPSLQDYTSLTAHRTCFDNWIWVGRHMPLPIEASGVVTWFCHPVCPSVPKLSKKGTASSVTLDPGMKKTHRSEPQASRSWRVMSVRSTPLFYKPLKFGDNLLQQHNPVHWAVTGTHPVKVSSRVVFMSSDAFFICLFLRRKSTSLACKETELKSQAVPLSHLTKVLEALALSRVLAVSPHSGTALIHQKSPSAPSKHELSLSSLLWGHPTYAWGPEVTKAAFGMWDHYSDTSWSYLY